MIATHSVTNKQSTLYSLDDIVHPCPEISPASLWSLYRSLYSPPVPLATSLGSLTLSEGRSTLPLSTPSPSALITVAENAALIQCYDLLEECLAKFNESSPVPYSALHLRAMVCEAVLIYARSVHPDSSHTDEERLAAVSGAVELLLLVLSHCHSTHTPSVPAQSLPSASSATKTCPTTSGLPVVHIHYPSVLLSVVRVYTHITRPLTLPSLAPFLLPSLQTVAAAVAALVNALLPSPAETPSPSASAGAGARADKDKERERAGSGAPPLTHVQARADCQASVDAIAARIRHMELPCEGPSGPADTYFGVLSLSVSLLAQLAATTAHAHALAPPTTSTAPPVAPVSPSAAQGAPVTGTSAASAATVLLAAHARALHAYLLALTRACTDPAPFLPPHALTRFRTLLQDAVATVSAALGPSKVLFALLAALAPFYPVSDQALRADAAPVAAVPAPFSPQLAVTAALAFLNASGADTTAARPVLVLCARLLGVPVAHFLSVDALPAAPQWLCTLLSGEDTALLASLPGVFVTRAYVCDLTREAAREDCGKDGKEKERARERAAEKDRKTATPPLPALVPSLQAALSAPPSATSVAVVRAHLPACSVGVLAAVASAALRLGSADVAQACLLYTHDTGDDDLDADDAHASSEDAYRALLQRAVADTHAPLTIPPRSRESQHALPAAPDTLALALARTHAAAVLAMAGGPGDQHLTTTLTAMLATAGPKCPAPALGALGTTPSTSAAAAKAKAKPDADAADALLAALFPTHIASAPAPSAPLATAPNAAAAMPPLPGLASSSLTFDALATATSTLPPAPALSPAALSALVALLPRLDDILTLIARTAATVHAHSRAPGLPVLVLPQTLLLDAAALTWAVASLILAQPQVQAPVLRAHAARNAPPPLTTVSPLTHAPLFTALSSLLSLLAVFSTHAPIHPHAPAPQLPIRSSPLALAPALATLSSLSFLAVAVSAALAAHHLRLARPAQARHCLRHARSYPALAPLWEHDLAPPQPLPPSSGSVSAQSRVRPSITTNTPAAPSLASLLPAAALPPPALPSAPVLTAHSWLRIADAAVLVTLARPQLPQLQSLSLLAQLLDTESDAAPAHVAAGASDASAAVLSPLRVALTALTELPEAHSAAVRVRALTTASVALAGLSTVCSPSASAPVSPHSLQLAAVAAHLQRQIDALPPPLAAVSSPVRPQKPQTQTEQSSARAVLLAEQEHVNALAAAVQASLLCERGLREEPLPHLCAFVCSLLVCVARGWAAEEEWVGCARVSALALQWSADVAVAGHCDPSAATLTATDVLTPSTPTGSASPVSPVPAPAIATYSAWTAPVRAALADSRAHASVLLAHALLALADHSDAAQLAQRQRDDARAARSHLLRQQAEAEQLSHPLSSGGLAGEFSPVPASAAPAPPTVPPLDSDSEDDEEPTDRTARDHNDVQATSSPQALLSLLDTLPATVELLPSRVAPTALRPLAHALLAEAALLARQHCLAVPLALAMATVAGAYHTLLYAACCRGLPMVIGDRASGLPTTAYRGAVTASTSAASLAGHGGAPAPADATAAASSSFSSVEVVLALTVAPPAEPPLPPVTVGTAAPPLPLVSPASLLVLEDTFAELLLTLTRATAALVPNLTATRADPFSLPLSLADCLPALPAPALLHPRELLAATTFAPPLPALPLAQPAALLTHTLSSLALPLALSLLAQGRVATLAPLLAQVFSALPALALVDLVPVWAHTTLHTALAATMGPSFLSVLAPAHPTALQPSPPPRAATKPPMRDRDRRDALDTRARAFSPLTQFPFPPHPVLATFAVAALLSVSSRILPLSAKLALLTDAPSLIAAAATPVYDLSATCAVTHAYTLPSTLAATQPPSARAAAATPAALPVLSASGLTLGLPVAQHYPILHAQLLAAARGLVPVAGAKTAKAAQLPPHLLPFADSGFAVLPSFPAFLPSGLPAHPLAVGSPLSTLIDGAPASTGHHTVPFLCALDVACWQLLATHADAHAQAGAAAGAPSAPATTTLPRVSSPSALATHAPAPTFSALALAFADMALMHMPSASLPTQTASARPLAQQLLPLLPPPTTHTAAAFNASPLTPTLFPARLSPILLATLPTLYLPDSPLPAHTAAYTYAAFGSPAPPTSSSPPAAALQPPRVVSSRKQLRGDALASTTTLSASCERFLLHTGPLRLAFLPSPNALLSALLASPDTAPTPVFPPLVSGGRYVGMALLCLAQALVLPATPPHADDVVPAELSALSERVLTATHLLARTIDALVHVALLTAPVATASAQKLKLTTPAAAPTPAAATTRSPAHSALRVGQLSTAIVLLHRCVLLWLHRVAPHKLLQQHQDVLPAAASASAPLALTDSFSAAQPTAEDSDVDITPTPSRVARHPSSRRGQRDAREPRKGGRARDTRSDHQAVPAAGAVVPRASLSPDSPLLLRMLARLVVIVDSLPAPPSVLSLAATMLRISDDASSTASASTLMPARQPQLKLPLAHSLLDALLSLLLTLLARRRYYPLLVAVSQHAMSCLPLARTHKHWFARVAAESDMGRDLSLLIPRIQSTAAAMVPATCPHCASTTHCTALSCSSRLAVLTRFWLRMAAPAFSPYAQLAALRQAFAAARTSHAPVHLLQVLARAGQWVLEVLGRGGQRQVRVDPPHATPGSTQHAHAQTPTGARALAPLGTTARTTGARKAAATLTARRLPAVEADPVLALLAGEGAAVVNADTFDALLLRAFSLAADMDAGIGRMLSDRAIAAEQSLSVPALACNTLAPLADIDAPCPDCSLPVDCVPPASVPPDTLLVLLRLLSLAAGRADSPAAREDVFSRVSLVALAALNATITHINVLAARVARLAHYRHWRAHLLLLVDDLHHSLNHDARVNIHTLEQFVTEPRPLQLDIPVLPLLDTPTAVLDVDWPVVLCHAQQLLVLPVPTIDTHDAEPLPSRAELVSGVLALLQTHALDAHLNIRVSGGEPSPTASHGIIERAEVRRALMAVLPADVDAALAAAEESASPLYHGTIAAHVLTNVVGACDKDECVDTQPDGFVSTLPAAMLTRVAALLDECSPAVHPLHTRMLLSPLYALTALITTVATTTPRSPALKPLVQSHVVTGAALTVPRLATATVALLPRPDTADIDDYTPLPMPAQMQQLLDVPAAEESEQSLPVVLRVNANEPLLAVNDVHSAHVSLPVWHWLDVQRRHAIASLLTATHATAATAAREEGCAVTVAGVSLSALAPTESSLRLLLLHVHATAASLLKTHNAHVTYLRSAAQTHPLLDSAEACERADGAQYPRLLATALAAHFPPASFPASMSCRHLLLALAQLLTDAGADTKAQLLVDHIRAQTHILAALAPMLFPCSSASATHDPSLFVFTHPTDAVLPRVLPRVSAQLTLMDGDSLSALTHTGSAVEDVHSVECACVWCVTHGLWRVANMHSLRVHLLHGTAFAIPPTLTARLGLPTVPVSAQLDLALTAAQQRVAGPAPLAGDLAHVCSLLMARVALDMAACRGLALSPTLASLLLAHAEGAHVDLAQVHTHCGRAAALAQEESSHTAFARTFSVSLAALPLAARAVTAAEQSGMEGLLLRAVRLRALLMLILYTHACSAGPVALPAEVVWACARAGVSVADVVLHHALTNDGHNKPCAIGTASVDHVNSLVATQVCAGPEALLCSSVAALMHSHRTLTARLRHGFTQPSAAHGDASSCPTLASLAPLAAHELVPQFCCLSLELTSALATLHRTCADIALAHTRITLYEPAHGDPRSVPAGASTDPLLLALLASHSSLHSPTPVPRAYSSPCVCLTAARCTCNGGLTALDLATSVLHAALAAQQQSASSASSCAHAMAYTRLGDGDLATAATALAAREGSDGALSTPLVASLVGCAAWLLSQRVSWLAYAHMHAQLSRQLLARMQRNRGASVSTSDAPEPSPVYSLDRAEGLDDPPLPDEDPLVALQALITILNGGPPMTPDPAVMGVRGASAATALPAHSLNGLATALLQAQPLPPAHSLIALYSPHTLTTASAVGLRDYAPSALTIDPPLPPLAADATPASLTAQHTAALPAAVAVLLRSVAARAGSPPASPPKQRSRKSNAKTPQPARRAAPARTSVKADLSLDLDEPAPTLSLAVLEAADALAVALATHVFGGPSVADADALAVTAQGAASPRTTQQGPLVASSANIGSVDAELDIDAVIAAANATLATPTAAVVPLAASMDTPHSSTASFTPAPLPSAPADTNIDVAVLRAAATLGADAGLAALRSKQHSTPTGPVTLVAQGDSQVFWPHASQYVAAHAALLAVLADAISLAARQGALLLLARVCESAAQALGGAFAHFTAALLLLAQHARAVHDAARAAAYPECLVYPAAASGAIARALITPRTTLTPLARAFARADAACAVVPGAPLSVPGALRLPAEAVSTIPATAPTATTPAAASSTPTEASTSANAASHRLVRLLSLTTVSATAQQALTQHATASSAAMCALTAAIARLQDPSHPAHMWRSSYRGAAATPGFFAPLPALDGAPAHTITGTCASLAAHGVGEHWPRPRVHSPSVFAALHALVTAHPALVSALLAVSDPPEAPTPSPCAALAAVLNPVLTMVASALPPTHVSLALHSLPAHSHAQALTTAVFLPSVALPCPTAPPASAHGRRAEKEKEREKEKEKDRGDVQPLLLPRVAVVPPLSATLARQPVNAVARALALVGVQDHAHYHALRWAAHDAIDQAARAACKLPAAPAACAPAPVLRASSFVAEQRTNASASYEVDDWYRTDAELQRRITRPGGMGVLALAALALQAHNDPSFTTAAASSSYAKKPPKQKVMASQPLASTTSLWPFLRSLRGLCAAHHLTLAHRAALPGYAPATASCTLWLALPPSLAHTCVEAQLPLRPATSILRVATLLAPFAPPAAAYSVAPVSAEAPLFSSLPVLLDAVASAARASHESFPVALPPVNPVAGLALPGVDGALVSLPTPPAEPSLVAPLGFAHTRFVASAAHGSFLRAAQTIALARASGNALAAAPLVRSVPSTPSFVVDANANASAPMAVLATDAFSHPSSGSVHKPANKQQQRGKAAPSNTNAAAAAAIVWCDATTGALSSVTAEGTSEPVEAAAAESVSTSTDTTTVVFAEVNAAPQAILRAAASASPVELVCVVRPKGAPRPPSSTASPERGNKKQDAGCADVYVTALMGLWAGCSVLCDVQPRSPTPADAVTLPCSTAVSATELLLAAATVTGKDVAHCTQALRLGALDLLATQFASTGRALHQSIDALLSQAHTLFAPTPTPLPGGRKRADSKLGSAAHQVSTMPFDNKTINGLLAAAHTLQHAWTVEPAALVILHAAPASKE